MLKTLAVLKQIKVEFPPALGVTRAGLDGIMFDEADNLIILSLMATRAEAVSLGVARGTSPPPSSSVIGRARAGRGA